MQVRNTVLLPRLFPRDITCLCSVGIEPLIVFVKLEDECSFRYDYIFSWRFKIRHFSETVICRNMIGVTWSSCWDAISWSERTWLFSTLLELKKYLHFSFCDTKYVLLWILVNLLNWAFGVHIVFCYGVVAIIIIIVLNFFKRSSIELIHS